MPDTLAQAAFRLGFFLVFVSGMLLLFLESGTAEQAITIFTFLISLFFLIGIVIWVRLGQRKP
jgi:uncharacterized membrane protein